MRITQSERLTLREVTPDDDEFIFVLLNDPDWIKNIGDRSIHSLEDAQRFIQSAFIEKYASQGFGLWVIETNDTDKTPLGLCGLVDRPSLPGIDLGYALLPQARGKGYINEAAQLTIAFCEQHLDVNELLAITSPDNQASKSVLLRLGFTDKGEITLEDNGDTATLFSRPLP